jgi:MFS family permease
MLGVAVAWQLYELTGSALDLGLVGLAQFVPMVLLTLVVGQVADRYDRRLIVIGCEVVKAATAAALAWGAIGGGQTRTTIFALIALLAAAQAFENPAMSALVPEVVDRRLIAPAMAWIVSAGQTAQIVGPALGGLLYAFGPGAAYATAGVLFILAGALAVAIRVARAVRPREPITVEAVFSGVAFIVSRRVLLGGMSLDLFAVLFGGATALLPVYAKDILGAGPVGLGLLRSAPAVGALVISIFLARFPLERRIGPTLFWSVMVFGAATVVFGLSTSFALSLVALSVLGAADVVSMVIRLSLAQIRTPDAMRGRVSAVHSLFTGSGCCSFPSSAGSAASRSRGGLAQASKWRSTWPGRCPAGCSTTRPRSSTGRPLTRLHSTPRARETKRGSPAGRSLTHSAGSASTVAGSKIATSAQ